MNSCTAVCSIIQILWYNGWRLEAYMRSCSGTYNDWTAMPTIMERYNGRWTAVPTIMERYNGRRWHCVILLELNGYVGLDTEAF